MVEFGDKTTENRPCVGNMASQSGAESDQGLVTRHYLFLGSNIHFWMGDPHFFYSERLLTLMYHNPRKNKSTIQVKKWPFDPVIDCCPALRQHSSYAMVFKTCFLLEALASFSQKPQGSGRSQLGRNDLMIMYTCVPERTYLIFSSMSYLILYMGIRNLPVLFCSENWLLKLILTKYY